MAMTKDVKEFIGVLDNGVLEYRRTVRALDDDGSLIGERHWRATYTPGDPTQFPVGTRLRRVAIAVWTAEVVAAYNAQQGA